MSTNSKIEWTDATWNPVVGCSKCSPGCDHCYAEVMANRLSGVARKRVKAHLESGTESSRLDGTTKYLDVINAGHWNGKVCFDEDELRKPHSWRKPRTVFVCSMGDLFHKSVSAAWIAQIWKVMKSTQQHRYLVLTKRPERMARVATVYTELEGVQQHIGLGATVCNQQEADEKIPELMRAPAAMRFLSVEPMLGPISLIKALRGLPEGNLSWVICGGESGRGARPMERSWVRNLRDQCAVLGIPFFFKQWGAYNPLDISGKCRYLDGIIHDGRPEEFFS